MQSAELVIVVKLKKRAKMAKTRWGDPKTSTQMLVIFFREYHEGLAQSGECIDQVNIGRLNRK